MRDFDKTLIKVTRNKMDFLRVSPAIFTYKEAISDEAYNVIRDFKRFYKDTGNEYIKYDDFVHWLKISHNVFTDIDYKNIFAETEGDAYICNENLLKMIATEAASNRISRSNEKYRNGSSDMFLEEVKAAIDDAESFDKSKASVVSVSIEDVLREEERNDGLKWRNKIINESMRPLRSGDFIIIAARPDVGKTSFIASQVTHMASYLDEGRPALWINNEGPGSRIAVRCWQAALGKTLKEISELNQSGTMHSTYANAVGGEDNIKVYDAHDLYTAGIEKIIEKEKPGLIVLDMIDNITFDGHLRNNAQRTDQILESLYQWGRTMAVKNDCVVVATSQVSADGEGLRFPLLSMLKDSKTGKQGAADAIVMLGKDSEDSDARYLSLPKNKLNKQDGKKDIRKPVYFDQVRCMFNDNPTVTSGGGYEVAGFD